MGAAAAALVPPNQTVFLDAGTSCFQVGKALSLRSDITLISNSPALVQAVQDAPAKVVCCGGELRPVSGALVGALSLEWLSHLRADFAFVGASGLSAEEGASTTELGEAAVKQTMLQRVTSRVLVADSRKWERPVLTRFAPWESFDYWITDDELPAAAARRVQDRGPRVIRASAKGSRRGG
jgi:DeoR family fructose operon transcriptional repressor